MADQEPIDQIAARILRERFGVPPEVIAKAHRVRLELGAYEYARVSIEFRASGEEPVDFKRLAAQQPDH